MRLIPYADTWSTPPNTAYRLVEPLLPAPPPDEDIEDVPNDDAGDEPEED